MQITPPQAQSFISPLLLSKSDNIQHPPTASESQSADQAEIAKLRKRDQEVRSHEQAHLAAAGGLAKTGASFSFQRGPDGKQYAVGGEVQIDTSPVSGDPNATIRKAKRIRAAALAPADPSAQDRTVAASATALEAQAQQKLKKEKQEANSSRNLEPTLSRSPHIDLFV